MSGYPAGWAAYDHWWKPGFRTRVSDESGRYRETMYGPVPGRNGARSMKWPAAPGGAGAAMSRASLSGKSGSASLSRKVTVPAASSVTIPADRSHRRGFRTHAGAPTMPSK